MYANCCSILAAHCLIDKDGNPLLPSDFVVRVGISKRSESRTDMNTLDVYAIFPHPRYRGEINNYKDDIGILELKDPARTGPNVKEACLSFDEKIYLKVIGTGYGRTEVPTIRKPFGPIETTSVEGDVLKYAFFKEKRSKDCPPPVICVDRYYEKSEDSVCKSDSGKLD